METFKTIKLWKRKTNPPLKKELALQTSEMERTEAAQFLGELADWAYANSEAMLIDDEPGADDMDFYQHFDND